MLTALPLSVMGIKNAQGFSRSVDPQSRELGVFSGQWFL